MVMLFSQHVQETSQYHSDTMIASTPEKPRKRDGKRNIAFLYDSDNVVSDIQAGSVTTQYVTPYLDQNLSMTRGGATYYYTPDGLGSVRTLTDSAGGVVNRYDYSAFGEKWAPEFLQAVPNLYFGMQRRPRQSGARIGKWNWL